MEDFGMLSRRGRNLFADGRAIAVVLVVIPNSSLTSATLAWQFSRSWQQFLRLSTLPPDWRYYLLAKPFPCSKTTCYKFDTLGSGSS